MRLLKWIPIVAALALAGCSYTVEFGGNVDIQIITDIEGIQAPTDCGE